MKTSLKRARLDRLLTGLSEEQIKRVLGYVMGISVDWNYDVFRIEDICINEATGIVDAFAGDEWDQRCVIDCMEDRARKATILTREVILAAFKEGRELQREIDVWAK